MEDESQFYIVCYDPELKKIFLSEFTTEKLVTDIGFKIPCGNRGICGIPREIAVEFIPLASHYDSI